MANVDHVFNLSFILFYSLVLPFLTVHSSDDVPQRTIKMNVHCQNGKQCLQGSAVFEVIAEGKTDEVRYLWSAIGAPSISVAYFAKKMPKNKLDIKWKDRDTVSSIKYDDAPTDSLGMILSAVYEYNDTDDSVDISKSKLAVKHDLQDLNWNHTMNKEKNSTEFIAKDGEIKIEMMAAYAEDRDKTPPHQQFNSNSTRFRISLNEFQTNPNITSPRFTFECSFLHANQKGDSVLNIYRSLDDEYTPSIFKLYQAVLPDNLGFGQWKPIAYTKDSLDYHTQVHHSLKVNIDKNETLTKINAVNSIASLFIPQKSAYAVNVSFGESTDGFYRYENGNPKDSGKGYKYLLWSGTVGLGVPPEDGISTTVLIIIIAGLGTPALVLMVGGVYLCVKKYKDNKSQSYSSIN